MLQRITLYAVLGLVLDAAKINIDHWAFWCILALFIASEWMTRREVLESVEEYISAVREQIARVAHAAEEVKKSFEEKNK
jgi:hypothetical protein